MVASTVATISRINSSSHAASSTSPFIAATSPSPSLSSPPAMSRPAAPPTNKKKPFAETLTGLVDALCEGRIESERTIAGSVNATEAWFSNELEVSTSSCPGEGGGCRREEQRLMGVDEGFCFIEVRRKKTNDVRVPLSTRFSSTRIVKRNSATTIAERRRRSRRRNTTIITDARILRRRSSSNRRRWWRLPYLLSRPFGTGRDARSRRRPG